MKIVQVCPRYPPQTGGVETHVREVSERLVDRGHEVTLLTADAHRVGQAIECQNGVNVRRHSGFAPGGAYHFAPGIIQGVRRIRGDIVHAHNVHAFPLLFAAIGTSSEPLVATPHYHRRSADRLRDFLFGAYRPLAGWVLDQAAAVIAVSEWEAGHLRTDFGIEPEVVPNGINPERFAGVEPEIRDRPYILTVGRLEPYKNVEDVIRMLPDLAGYDLLVAGEGPARSELIALASEIGVDNRVDFFGFVPEERLPRLYAGAAAYITLSQFEAFGLTVAEALAAGTPCVVYDDGVLADWTRFDGVVGVESTTPIEIAEAVESAVGSTVSATLPTWDDTVKRLLEIYDSLYPVMDS